MQTKSLKKVLSTLLATAMVASMVTVPVFATGTDVGAITNSALTANTIYHEGMASDSLGNYSQGTLGGNWYDSLIDTAGVTVAEGVEGVTLNVNDKAFTVNVPIKFAEDTEITATSTGDAAAAWEELKLFQKMPKSDRLVALGFQMAIPTAINSTNISFSASEMTRNSAEVPGMFVLNNDDDNRASIAENSAVNDADVKTAVMYTNIATADPAVGGSGNTAPTKYTISSSDADTQRTYVYTFKDTSDNELAKYTVKFNVTFADATPLTKDNIVHDEVNGSITSIDAGTNGEVVVTGEDDPTGYIGINLKSLITDDILGEAASTAFEGKRVIDSAGETAMNVYELKSYDANDANCKWVKFGDSSSAEVSNDDAIAGGQIFYYPANKISAGAPAAFITYVNTGKKYSYTFTGNDGSKYTLKLDVKADASTPDPAKKPIKFSVEQPFTGGQLDGSAELGTDTFGFTVTGDGTEDVKVTGSTTESKIDAAASAEKQNTANPAFVVYYHVDAIAGIDDATKFAKYNYYRNGVKINDALPFPSDGTGSISYKKDADDNGSTFKMAISLFGKVGNKWAMKYNVPFTDKLQLLNKDGEVIAEVLHTFDFSGASINGGAVADDIVSPPAVAPGAPSTTVNNEQLVSAMIGAKDSSGNSITVGATDKVQLAVKAASINDDIADAIAESDYIVDKSAVFSMDIGINVNTAAGTTKVKTLGRELEITMNVPASLSRYQNLVVYHKTTGGVEKIPATRSGSKFTFKMSSFSPITVVGMNAVVTPPYNPGPSVPNYGFGGYGGGWYTAANTYAVSYNTLGGSSVATTYVNAGSVLTLPTAPTRDGYVFSGWYFDAACTQQVPGEYRPSGAVTLYAFWQSNTPVVAPTNPTAPTTPTTPTTVPQTGDASAVPFVALLFVAAAAIVVIMVPKKKFGTK